MKTVHKFVLGSPGDLRPRTTLQMPTDAKILSAQVQDGKAVLWALVGTRWWKAERQILALVTGEKLPVMEDDAVFISTLQFADGAFVIHLFDLGETP